MLKFISLPAFGMRLSILVLLYCSLTLEYIFSDFGALPRFHVDKVRMNVIQTVISFLFDYD